MLEIFPGQLTSLEEELIHKIISAFLEQRVQISDFAYLSVKLEQAGKDRRID